MLLLQCACSSGNVFENSIIKFTYPAEFQEIKPQDAPHMILKLESKNKVLTISRWEYGIDKSIDAWNDEVYNNYSNGLSNTNCVLLEKVVLQTKYENLRAIKIYANIGDNINKIGSISYLILKNGDLFVITFNQPIVLTNTYSSKQVEDILYWLQIKDKDNSSDEEYSMLIEEFETYVLNQFKSVNESLPIQVDEVTTLFCISSMGKNVMFKYRIDSSIIEYMNNEWADDYKERTLRNMMASVPNSDEYASYYANSSIKMTYLFFDEDDNLVRTIHITPKDFKP